MILSNVEIQKALDERRLVIDPEPSPRELKPGIKYCPYDTTAVDLKLHNEISVPKGGTFAYDLTKPGSVSDSGGSDRQSARREGIIKSPAAKALR